ncbi:TATA box-binding protein-associated factor RNA polymerase I subunit B isoform X3 [Rhinatrema bivittatum]|nr:TATA box-binding protein-associated factor RNA polymerase I subunit B isoform X3 [Rhinatrema bivittatum]XP_029451712.1 TATA box-binding protein-associated factor RNA polymerase I subunit B isoform X3 [Rhinatrema bivittatum]XP_029451713.1 TATA box-binding protein-associated factor RNA polymerase I subunit B isoform X3 [Rhinatrema bivittatum]
MCPEIKDEILCNFWRRYLQKSKQAYTKRPAHASAKKHTISESTTSDSDWETEVESFIFNRLSSSHESEGESCSDVGSGNISSDVNIASDTTFVCSGSVDGGSYLHENQKERLLMSMPMTLAFCYMALLWWRESITLVDLLRFVEDGHIPYVNTFQQFPEELKLYGPDVKIFQVQSLPSYDEVFKMMLKLAAFLDLPSFPQITEKCFFHPNVLCIKYLMEANLPDEFHNWTCRVVKKTGLGDVAFLTFDPLKSKRMVKYEVQAAALIVVVLKLFFLLDDRYEWLLSNFVSEENKTNKEGTPEWFNFQKWYIIMKSALDEAQKKVAEECARYQWKSETPLFYSKERKWTVNKRKQMAVTLQKQFGKLIGSSQPAKIQNPASFQFNWDEENTDRNCFHGHSLEGVMQEQGKSFTTVNSEYWLNTLKLCKMDAQCNHWTKYEESNFPSTYQFILNLFSFLLRVKASSLHQEVSLVEHRLFRAKLQKNPRSKPRK